MTLKQQSFCREYLVDLNATQAAIRAGYSPRTAASIGQENLKKPEIQEAIQGLIDERSRRVEVTSDMVIEELARLAFVDIGKLYDESGKLLPVHEIPEGTRRAVLGIDVFEETEGRGEAKELVGLKLFRAKGIPVAFQTKKVRVADKIRALELLGKHLRLFADRTEITGADGGPLVVESSNRTPEEVAEYSERLFEGYLAYRDPVTSAGMTMTAEAAKKLNVAVLAYATRDQGASCDAAPFEVGQELARIDSIRSRITGKDDRQENPEHTETPQ